MAKCKGCGAEILWAKNENDKRVPLDAKAPVYQLLSLGEGALQCVRSADSYVTHFATCPKANEFSGSKPR